jgi:hypothetical protein
VSSDIELVLAPVLPSLPARPLITPAISRFQRGWPLAALGSAALVTVAWIGLLGFGLFKLFEPVFLWSIS